MNSFIQLPPSWWRHSSSAWNDIDNFFSSEKYSGEYFINECNKNEYCNEECWRSISKGRSNSSYCFSCDQYQFFIQITNRSNIQFLPYEKTISLKKIISASEYRELSPWLVETFFQSKEVQVQKWFESESLDLSLNKNKNIIEMLAKYLAKLHQIKSTKLPNFDLERHLLKYQKIALDRKKNRDLQVEINACLNNAVLKLKAYQQSSLCHYDLNLHNILLNRNDLKIKIIDWEYACMGDPVLDITAVINNFGLEKETEAYFISSYRQHLNKSTSIDLLDTKLNDMKLLNQYIFQLWEYGQ